MKTAIEFLREKQILAKEFTKCKGKIFDGIEFDLVDIIKEFAKIKCAEQRQLISNELVTWTEDLSLPNQNRIHEMCQDVDEPEM